MGVNKALLVGAVVVGVFFVAGTVISRLKPESATLYDCVQVWNSSIPLQLPVDTPVEVSTAESRSFERGSCWFSAANDLTGGSMWLDYQKYLEAGSDVAVWNQSSGNATAATTCNASIVQGGELILVSGGHAC